VSAGEAEFVGAPDPVPVGVADPESVGVAEVVGAAAPLDEALAVAESVGVAESAGAEAVGAAVPRFSSAPARVSVLPL
jgi:hypothetical protein